MSPDTHIPTSTPDEPPPPRQGETLACTEFLRDLQAAAELLRKGGHAQQAARMEMWAQRVARARPSSEVAAAAASELWIG